MNPAVVLQDAPLKIKPGDQGSMPVTIRNDSPVVDDFTVDIVGAPGGWCVVEPPVLPLFPGTEGQVKVTFTPPRESTTPAGWTPYAVRVSSREDPGGTTITEGVLQVLVFHELVASLVPTTSRGRRTGRHRLSLENRGNAPTVAAIAAVDPERLLAMRVAPAQVALAPGESGAVHIRARGSVFFRGVAQHRSFQVNVTPDEADPIILTGALLQRSLFAGWTVRLLLLGLLLGGLLAYLLLRPAKVLTSATRKGVALIVPAQFQAVPVDTTSIRLSWSPVNTALVANYTIREQANGARRVGATSYVDSDLGPSVLVDAAWEVVASPKGEESAHTITGLTPNTTHCYDVQASNPNGVSDWSPLACAKTLPTPPGPPAPGVPGQPAQLTATVIDSGDIRVSWVAVAGATGYVLDESGQRVATAGAEETSHAFSGLLPGSTHCYNLQVVGPGGTSAPTPPVCATTVGAGAAGVPLPPQEISVTAVDTATLRVNWTDPNATDTAIQVFESGGLVATEPQGSAAHTFTGLAPGQQHCYQVRAVSGTLVSSFAPDQPACGTTLTPTAGQLQSDPAIASFQVANTQLSQTGNRVTVGEFVNYQLTLSIPQVGVKNLSVTDVLPAGMSLWSGNAASATPGGTVTPDPLLTTDAPGGFTGVLQNAAVSSCAPSIPGCGSSSTPGQVLTANFGNVVNGNTDPTKNQTLVFKFAAVVLDVAGNSARAAVPTTLSNTAVVNYLSSAGAPKSLTSPATVLSVDEPNLVASLPAGAGTTRVITVTHAPTSTADAFVPTITAVVPSSGFIVTAATCNPACSGGAAGIAGTTITAKWPTLALSPNNSLSLTIQYIALPPPLGPGGVMPLAVSVAWQSLADTTISSSFNGAAHARSHPGVASFNAAVDNYVFPVPNN
jgi:hypothetical protein